VSACGQAAAQATQRLPAGAVWAGNKQTAPTKVEQALLGNVSSAANRTIVG